MLHAVHLSHQLRPVQWNVTKCTCTHDDQAFAGTEGTEPQLIFHKSVASLQSLIDSLGSSVIHFGS